MGMSRQGVCKGEGFNQKPKDGERDVPGRGGPRMVSPQGPGRKQKMSGPGS